MPNTPPPAQAEPPVAPKPATPCPVQSGPAATATPVATPLPIAAAEKPSTSNSTRTESPAPPAVPKIDTPATALVTTPTRPQHQEASSPQDRPKQFGLYVTGVSTQEAVRALFSSEIQNKIQRIETKHPKNRPENIYFFAYFESIEVARETLEQLPEDLKMKRSPGEHKPWVKLMDDFGSFSNSRPGMSDSKWGRGTGTGGGNTSESDNNMGGGYRRGGYHRGRGRGGAYGSERGGGPRGRGGPKRGRGFDGGDGGSQHQSTD